MIANDIARHLESNFTPFHLLASYLLNIVTILILDVFLIFPRKVKDYKVASPPLG